MSFIMSPIAYGLACGALIIGGGVGYSIGSYVSHAKGVNDGIQKCEGDAAKQSLDLVERAQKARNDAAMRELGGLPDRDPFSYD